MTQIIFYAIFYNNNQVYYCNIAASSAQGPVYYLLHLRYDREPKGRNAEPWERGGGGLRCCSTAGGPQT